MLENNENNEKRPFNGLTPAEAERLALLLEELGEVQQAIGKILRHGYESSNPDRVGPTNRGALESELGDVAAAIDLMIKAKDIREHVLWDGMRLKLANVGRYLHCQPAAGVAGV